MAVPGPRGERFVVNLRELSGALGDLGTLLPLMLGTIAVAGLAPTPVLLGFAVFYIATALHYRLPIPVQPMKAVAAVLLTVELTPAGIAASGALIGAALLVLGATGWIGRLARLVPQSVLAGLQLGLGLLRGNGLHPLQERAQPGRLRLRQAERRHQAVQRRPLGR